MDIEHSLDSIPIDLFYDIFLRLPAKSVGRCRCVSKILASKLGSEDFKQLFLTRSLTRPRFLYAVRRYRDFEWAFYSSAQPQNPYEKSSLVVTRDFHTKFRRSVLYQPPNVIYAYGLCYLSEVCEGEDRSSCSNVICNPSTRQYVVLPKLRIEKEEPKPLLGYDPIGKQFKVLLINTLDNHILTLGTETSRWRNIQCPLLSFRRYVTDWNCDGICINGILYYLAQRNSTTTSCVIVCFDVKTETFGTLIDLDFLPLFYKLINYKGKLCMISLGMDDGEFDLQMCVLEDVEKQEWLKFGYTLPKNISGISVVGMTATNEIVLWNKYASKPSHVYYFNPEKNTLQKVEVHGFEDRGEVRVFMDHVEDLHVNDAKLFKPNLRITNDNVEIMETTARLGMRR